MNNTESFIDLCTKVIKDNHTGSLDFRTAAIKIYQQANQYPLEANAHPMLEKVYDLSFDIAEDYRSPEADAADWNTIVKTIEDYNNGNWEQTCWMLTIACGEYIGDAVTKSYTATIWRQNGQTVIETAVNNLKVNLERIAHVVNDEQTDERYLQNIAMLVPQGSSKLKLMSIDLAECLIVPYNTTRI